jgi:hypothetical protein
MVLALLLLPAFARGADITAQLPPGLKAASAAAYERGKITAPLPAELQAGQVRFTGLKADGMYDLRLRLDDGRELRGVDLRWYAPDAAPADEHQFSDEDRQEIQDICNVPSFYDRAQVVRFEGGGGRIAALVNLVRDRDFHAGKGQVIWRSEVWYFRYQAGGWEKVSQQALVLDRQRFASRAEYEKTVARIRFLPALGGVKAGAQVQLSADEVEQGIRMPTEPATRPAH